MITAALHPKLRSYHIIDCVYRFCCWTGLTTFSFLENVTEVRMYLELCSIFQNFFCAWWGVLMYASGQAEEGGLKIAEIYHIFCAEWEDEFLKVVCISSVPSIRSVRSVRLLGTVGAAVRACLEGNISRLWHCEMPHSYTCRNAKINPQNHFANIPIHVEMPKWIPRTILLKFELCNLLCLQTMEWSYSDIFFFFLETAKCIHC